MSVCIIYFLNCALKDCRNNIVCNIFDYKFTTNFFAFEHLEEFNQIMRNKSYIILLFKYST